MTGAANTGESQWVIVSMRERIELCESPFSNSSEVLTGSLMNTWSSVFAPTFEPPIEIPSVHRIEAMSRQWFAASGPRTWDQWNTVPGHGVVLGVRHGDSRGSVISPVVETDNYTGRQEVPEAISTFGMVEGMVVSA